MRHWKVITSALPSYLDNLFRGDEKAPCYQTYICRYLDGDCISD